MGLNNREEGLWLIDFEVLVQDMHGVTERITCFVCVDNVGRQWVEPGRVLF